MKQPERPVFGAFDSAREIGLRLRNLPHWSQAETTVFVTFRTADSLPREVILRNERQLQEWLKARNLPLRLANLKQSDWDEDEAELISELSPPVKSNFLRLKSRLMHYTLDECHGACHLRRKGLREKVAEAILHHEGRKYELDCFVVMPNHVHAIVQFHDGFDLRVVGQSWMRFSARRINSVLGATGPFWQAEPFDHLIRSERQFQYLREYIADNPAKANLGSDDYLLWKRG